MYELESMMHAIGVSFLDAIALALFFVAWLLHLWIVNYSPLKHKTISARMRIFRQLWMHNMVFRNPKMTDALIQNSLQYGVIFFASTSILLIGALMAGLGASDQAIKLLGELPFAVRTTRTVWEVKVMLVIFIFVYAFFKFAWSYRLFNYVMIMIGAAPDKSVDIPEDHPEHKQQLKTVEAYAIQVGQLHTIGANHFTIGLNAYFFALAACAWFLNPLLFIAATVWVSYVLYRRSFWSNFGRTLNTIEAFDPHPDKVIETDNTSDTDKTI